MTDPIRARRARSPRINHPRIAAPGMPLALRSYEPRHGVVVVAAAGEIDLANRDALAAELAGPADDPATGVLVCDLSATSFVSCSGLSVLLDAHARLTARGAVLRVVTARSTVLRMLDATGQRTVLDVRPDVDSALCDGPMPAGDGRALTELAASLTAAVAQTTELAAAWGRLAEQVAALDAELLRDGRGVHWRPRETLAEMAEDLRVLQNHLATGALLAAPAVEDLGHLRSTAAPAVDH
jgi:anti-sigma B factor antagonist